MVEVFKLRTIIFELALAAVVFGVYCYESEKAKGGISKYNCKIMYKDGRCIATYDSPIEEHPRCYSDLDTMWCTCNSDNCHLFENIYLKSPDLDARAAYHLAYCQNLFKREVGVQEWKKTEFCPKGWVYFPDTKSCYWVGRGKNYPEAKQVCERFGSNLASIHSEKENTFVSELDLEEGMGEQAKNSTYLKHKWLAGYKKNGNWLNSDKTKVDYFNWASKEPNNKRDEESCVMMYQSFDESFSGKWNDLQCNDYKMKYVCKKRSYVEKVSTNPTTKLSTTTKKPATKEPIVISKQPESMKTTTTQKPTTTTQKQTRAPKKPTTTTHKPTRATQKATTTTKKPTTTTQKQTRAPKKPTTTSQKPTMTTQKPTTTTQKPPRATKKPTMTTQKPTRTTQKPTTTTKKPTTTTQKQTRAPKKPTTTTQKPTMPTQKPTTTTQKPTRATKKPTMTTQKPITTTQKPTRATTKPATTTQKPTGTTQKPTTTTQRPTTTINKPTTTTTQKPTTTTQKPTRATTNPTRTTQKPIPTTKKPTRATKKPTTTTQKPTTITQKPTRATTKPTRTTQKPIPTTQKPTTSTQKPTTTTKKETTTTQKSHTTTQKRTRATKKSTTITQKPSTTNRKPTTTTHKPSTTTTRPAGKKPQPTPPTANNTNNTTMVKGCEKGWVHFQNHCYKFGYNLGWYEAELKCNVMGAHIASIHSEEENTFLSEFNKTGDYNANLPRLGDQKWIGAESVPEFSYVWADLTKFDYKNWEDPSVEKYVNFYCAMMYQYKNNKQKSGKWTTLECKIPLNYVCKKSLNKKVFD